MLFRCEDFISFCDIHNNYFATDEPDLPDDFNCCKMYFDESPTFSTQGTCFTTKKNILERTSFVFDGIKIWIHSDVEDRPEFTWQFHSEAPERNAVFFAITSSGEHPFVALSRKPYSVRKGDMKQVALSVRELDRREVNSKFCAKEEAVQFEAEYGLPYSKGNCEAVKGSGIARCWPSLRAGTSRNIYPLAAMQGCLATTFHCSFHLWQQIM